MPRTQAAVNQISAAFKLLSASKFDPAGVTLVQIAYDKLSKQWNCWVANDPECNYMIGRGAGPQEATRDFLSLNNISH